MEGQSVAKIVQQITETLSDAVAQLVVLVIALQEQNAEMPATLPQASGAVGQASNALVQVARALAEDDYADYPDIKEQILQAALGVESSSANLTKAVQNMKTASDRRGGWNLLVDACKIIAGKTILLLQIVYGAEIQRLFAAAEMARQALNKVDSKQAQTNPQEFANAAGDAASKANQLAEYVRAKANDTENPILKKELNDLADALQKDAQDLINNANALLSNPNDKNAQQKFDEALAKTKQDIKTAADLLEDDRVQAEDTINQLRGKEAGGSMFGKRAPTEKSPQKQLMDEDLNAAIHRAKGLADKLEALADVPDPKGVNDTLKQIQDAVADVKREGHAVANAADDPVQKRKMLAAVEGLDRVLPPQRDAAGKAAATPNKDDPSKKNLHDANTEYKRVLDDLADAANPGTALAEAIRNEKRALDDVKDVAQAGDAKALDKALKELNDANGTVAKLVKERAIPDSSPDERKDLLAALAALEPLIPKEGQAAKRLASNPHDKKTQHDLDDVDDDIRDILDRIASIAHPDIDRDIAAAAAGARAHGVDLNDAARRGDKNRVAQAANDVQKQHAKLAKQARAKAQKIDDPLKRSELLQAIDDLERLLPDQLRAAQDAVSAPRDKRRQQQLDDVSDDIAAAVARIERNINSEAPLEAAAQKSKKRADRLLETAKGGADGIDDAIAAAANANNELLREGRAAENAKDDPARRKALQSALDELEAIMPAQIRAAKAVKANPRDPKAQKDLSDETDRLKVAADAAIYNARPNNNDDARDAARAAAAELERLLAALAAGDEAGAADAAKHLGEYYRDLADDARARAKHADDPHKRREILAAVDALESLLPTALKATQEAVRAPRDKSKQKRVEEVGDKLRDAADGVLASMADSPDDALAALANEQARNVRNLQKAAHEGEPRGVELAAKTLIKKTPKLAQQARARATKVDDADRRKDILDALDAMEALLPQQIKAAKEATQAPHDKKKKQDLDDLSSDLQRTLDKISDAFVPRDAAEAILEAASRGDRLGKQIKDAAAKGDKPKVETDLPELEDAIRKLLQNAEAELASTDDPLARKQLEDAIRELEDLLRRLRGDALTAAQNPRDNRAQAKLADDLAALNNAAQKIIDSVKAGPMAESRKQDKDLEKLRDAVSKGNARGIAEATRALAKRTPKLAEQARAIAKKTDDPVLRKAMLDAVEQLEFLLPQQVAASLGVVQRPNDKSAKGNLDDISADFSNALDELNAMIRPSGKDKLRRAAADAEDKLDAVKDKAKRGDGPGTEEALKRFDAANDALLQRGRAEAAKEHDPLKSKQLQDALDELERLLGLIGDAARRTAKNPNDKSAQAALDDAVDQYKRSLNDIQGQADPSGRAKNDKMAQALAEIERLKPLVVAATDKLARNPRDAKAKKDLDDLLAELERPMSILGIAFTNPASEDGKVHDACKAHKKAVADVADAARKGDAQALSAAAQRAVAAQNDLIPKAKTFADNQDDPIKKKHILDAVDDLQRLLPQHIRAAQRVAGNPRDQEAQKDLSDLTDQLRNAVDRIDSVANPKNETVIVADVNKIRPAGEALKAKAKGGDKAGADKALQDLLDAAEDMLARARKDLEHEKDPRARKDLQDAIARLEDLLRKLKGDADKASANPRDAKAQNDLADDVARINEAANDISTKTKAPVIDEAEKENAALDRMAASARRGDAKDIAEAAKVVAAQNQKLAEQARGHAQRIDDPARKKALLDAIAELEAMLPRQINAAKDVLTNPNDAEKLRKLVQSADDYKDPIARIVASIKPTTEKEIDALAAAIGKDLGEVKSKAVAGDQKGTTDALAKTKSDIDKLKDKARQEAQTATDPAKKDALLKAIQDLDNLFNNLSRDANDAARNPGDKQKQAKLDDDILAIKQPIRDIQDAVALNAPAGANNSHARAAAILASLRSSNPALDPMALLKAAQDLAAALNDLTGDSKVTAYKNADSTGKGREALDLNDLLDQLDRAASGKPAPQKVSGASLDSLLGDLNNLATTTPAKPGSLEDSIQKVAETIQKRSRTIQADPVTGAHSTNIGQELQRLAQACQKGERQQFIISARAIAGHVNALNADLRALAAKTQDPELKGRLLENAAALQNFSVQLKILASVRAATFSPSADSDKGLIVLTQNFGVILNSTISTVGVVRLKYPNL